MLLISEFSLSLSERSKFILPSSSFFYLSKSDISPRRFLREIFSSESLRIFSSVRNFIWEFNRVLSSCKSAFRSSIAGSLEITRSFSIRIKFRRFISSYLSCKFLESLSISPVKTMILFWSYYFSASDVCFLSVSRRNNSKS